MLLPARLFRLFVSSTFSDFPEERDALHNRVFPQIARFCAERGARFDAVDLRWGISEEAGRDQRTMRVCLDEVHRCLVVTPRPNFMILVGDRYGWRPLPAEIPETEFHDLRQAAAARNLAGALDDLYPELDRNAGTPVYCLRPRRQESDAAWRDLERDGIAALRTAALDLRYSGAQLAKYGGSATEQEIYAGLLDTRVRSEASPWVHAFVRELPETLRPDQARHMFDWIDEGTPDKEARAAAHLIREQLRACLPAGNLHVYPVAWSREGLDISYLGEVSTVAGAHAAAAGSSVAAARPQDNLCQDVYDGVTAIIGQELAKAEEIPGIRVEITAHDQFAKERTQFFTGRQDVLTTISGYLHQDAGGCLVILGPSGSGKSAVMAKAMLDRKDQAGNAVIVGRFIGVTPDSSDGRALLASLSAEIAGAFEGPEPPDAADFSRLLTIFNEQLKLPARDDKGRCLIIFLDALDQLSDANREHELRWLPLENLPGRVRIVVSAAIGGALEKKLRERSPKDDIVDLPSLPPNDGGTLVDRWLEQAERRLLPDQRREVLDKFGAIGLPLYLRFAFEQARTWRSFDGVSPLASGVKGIIDQTFDSLSAEARHGKTLVSRSLAYLAAAREGLTEDEMLGLLWKDREIPRNFRERYPNSPKVRALPRVVWSLLYSDLKPYLTERNATGVAVLSFFHRQMRETVNSRYLPPKERRSVHRSLTRWFTPAASDPRTGAARFDARCVTELPYQQRNAGMWHELYETLCNFSFIEAKCAAGLIYDLIADYDAARQHGGWSEEERRRLKPLHDSFGPRRLCWRAIRR